MEPVKYVIRLCSSLLCHTYRDVDFLKLIEEELGIKAGETSPDGRFTLEIVRCLGMCFHAPSMMVNDQTYGDLTADRARKILRELKNNR